MKELLVDYIVSLTNLIGIVKFQLVVDTFNKQNKVQVSIKDINSVVDEYSEELRNRFVSIIGDEFVASEIIMLGTYNEEIANKKNKPYYIPNRFQLLRYGSKEYFHKNREYRKLFRFLKKEIKDSSISEEVSDKIGVYCMSSKGIDNIKEVFNNYNIIFDEVKNNKLKELIEDLAYNTRMWENNGFTVKEIKKLIELNDK